MLLIKSKFFVLSFFLAINPLFAQDDHLKLQVIEGMREALDNYDTCHYRTQMRFKSMGEDSFDTRNFNLSFRNNPANPLYGYDWEFSEYVKEGTLSYIFLADSFYYFFDQYKKISGEKLPDQIDLGSFPEVMRWYFGLEKTFDPFINAAPDEIVLKEIEVGYSMDLQVNSEERRNLVVNKNTYLPVQGINIIRDDDVGFEQIQEIHYYFNDNCKLLPDSALNVKYYITKGFELISREVLEAQTKPDRLNFTEEELDMLLSYPFINAAGDTNYLNDNMGKYILLDFWYASCQPCLQAMPLVNDIMEKYTDKGLAVIGINCFDKESRKSITDKLELRNITIPQLYGSREFVTNLDITSYPTYLLIMPDGRNQILNGGIYSVKETIEGLLD